MPKEWSLQKLCRSIFLKTMTTEKKMKKKQKSKDDDTDSNE